MPDDQGTSRGAVQRIAHTTLTMTYPLQTLTIWQ